MHVLMYGCLHLCVYANECACVCVSLLSIDPSLSLRVCVVFMCLSLDLSVCRSAYVCECVCMRCIQELIHCALIVIMNFHFHAELMRAAISMHDCMHSDIMGDPI